MTTQSVVSADPAIKEINQKLSELARTVATARNETLFTAMFIAEVCLALEIEGGLSRYEFGVSLVKFAKENLHEDVLNDISEFVSTIENFVEDRGFKIQMMMIEKNGGS